MLQLLTQQRTSVIAMDFGACSLRAVQLRKEQGIWCVHHWVNFEVEPENADHAPIDYATELPHAFRPGTFEGKKTALLLGPPDVEYKQLDVPPAVLDKPPEELRQMLQYELDQQMPWPAAESEIAAWPIKPDVTGNASAMVVSARTAAVQQRLEVLNACQLDCVCADVLPIAMIRVCRPSSEPSDTSEESLWGILDVGFQSCRFYLIHGDRPVYGRVLPGGGRELTTTLAEALHVDFRTAEQYKRIYGVEQTDRGFRSLLRGIARINEDALPGVLYAVLRDILNSMISGIERSCRYVLGQFPGVAVGPIYLVGGGARLRGLVDVLSRGLGVPVALPDPTVVFGNAEGGAEAPHHPIAAPANYAVLAPCVGLALREDLR